MKIKKIIVGILLSTMLIGIFTTDVMAGIDGAYDFELAIKSKQANTRTTGRYRSATNVNDSWKVNLETTTENNNDSGITTFWLENYATDNVSTSHNVPSGSGDHYYAAGTSAAQMTVYLTAEDNNYSFTKTYTISGYWDEETGDKHDIQE